METLKVAPNAPEAFKNKFQKSVGQMESPKADDVSDDDLDDVVDEPIDESGYEEPPESAGVSNESFDESGLSEKEINDLNAMKGRLKKAQEEMERYRIAAENGSFAAAKLLEMQERMKEKDAELEQLRQYKPKDEPKNNGLSAEEEEQLRDELGDFAAEKIISAIREKSSSTKTLEEQLTAMQEREQKAHEERFFSELHSQVPDFLNLYQSDKSFLQWLNQQEDFSGNSAAMLINDIGNTRDISRIGKIKQLVDSYKNQTQTKPKKKANARPSAGAAIEPSQTGKRQMTQADMRKLSELKRKPNNAAAIRDFYAQFE